jgi:hypothetical protein
MSFTQFNTEWGRILENEVFSDSAAVNARNTAVPASSSGSDQRFVGRRIHDLFIDRSFLPTTTVNRRTKETPNRRPILTPRRRARMNSAQPSRAGRVCSVGLSAGCYDDVSGGVYTRFLKRQLSLPVSMMSQ